jgi:hypothetical protein
MQIKEIKEGHVVCPATGKITGQCMNCELYGGEDEAGKVECNYPYKKPLPIIGFQLGANDVTRLDAKFRLPEGENMASVPITQIPKPRMMLGHPALYEFGECYEDELGEHLETWVRDKGKL